MKASMNIESDMNWATMAAFVVHTTARMLKHLVDGKGKSGGDQVRDATGKVCGSWSIES